MPTIGLYFTNDLTQKDVNALRKSLNELAANFGYTATRGPTTGQGNLAELLMAIDSGEIALLLLSDEQITEAIECLSVFKEEWSVSIVKSLKSALERQDD